MKKIIWNEDYASGHLEIDIQHKQFIGLINNISNAQTSNYPEDLINQLFLGLWKYTEFHFQDEEILMRANGYPGYASHKKIHDEILKILDHKMAAYDQHKCGLEEILVMLFEWFQTHTIHEDKKFGVYLRIKQGNREGVDVNAPS